MSQSFDLLSPALRHWVYDAGWPALRDAQELAIPLLLAQDRDVLISAATASGKTEAAFLPILSALDRPDATVAGLPAAGSAQDVDAGRAGSRLGGGVQVLYVAPLKALINDLHTRLTDMCKGTDIAVERWHGDVPGSSKQRFLKRPSGVLLLTPESLEAMFVLRGSSITGLFGKLQYVVVDELHAFLGTERGAQLSSLLHRLELAAGRQVVRVGLSATLGDMHLAARQLRPADPKRVQVITSNDGGQELLLSVRGYQQRPPPTPSRASEGDATAKAAKEDGTAPSTTTPQAPGDHDHDHGQPQHQHQHQDEDRDEDDVAAKGGTVQDEMAEHLFAVLRGTDNLLFANSRGAVERFADKLRRRSEAAQVPNEFLPHHGSLSRPLREDTESALKDPTRPTTAIATTTLEMGIDVGSVSSVAQIGPPPSVASLRQRLGRSGRREGPAVLRTYITEQQLDARSSLDDELRASLVQTVAMLELLLAGWCEPPRPAVLHTSTLVQQLLSLIAERGGIHPRQAHHTLCGEDGPFHGTDVQRFGLLLRALGKNKVLEQEADGLLLLGPVGEQTVNHHTFYSAFKTPEEYRLLHHGQQLGTVPVDFPLRPGLLIVFAGRRWQITGVQERQRAIDLVPAAGGRPPSFGGGGRAVHDTVRGRMRWVLAGNDQPAYLNPQAGEMLRQARDAYQRHELDQRTILPAGSGAIILPWAGTATSHTLALQLQLAEVPAGVDGLTITCPRSSPGRVLAALQEVADEPAADPVSLAATVRAREHNKYDAWLSPSLLNEDYAAHALDVPASQRLAQTLTLPAGEVGAADRLGTAR